MDILILILATWRLSSLLANEAGPYNIFGRLQKKIGVRFDDMGQPYATNEAAEGLICVWCNSVWVGFILTIIYLIYNPLVWLFLPLALSAGAILFNEVLWHAQTRRHS